MSFHYTKKDYSTNYLVLFTAVGVVLNVLFSSAATYFNLPLYLDTIGTIFVAILGGGLPGIITGLLTNLIINIWVHGYIYFSIINVSVALLASIFARFSKKSRFIRSTFFILTSALVCACMGMTIQYLIPGLPMLSNLEEVSHTIYSGTGKGYFYTLVLVSFFLNVVDKAISLAIGFFVFRMLPVSLREVVNRAGWKQKPLSLEEIKESKLASGKKSLMRKVALFLSATIILLSLILIWISITFYYEDCKEEYTDEAIAIVDSTAELLDVDQIGDYVKWGERADGYQDTDKLLGMLLNTSQGVNKLSVIITENNGYLILMQKGKEGVELQDLGKVMPYEDIYTDYFEKLKNGNAIDKLFYNHEQNIMTASTPVTDAAGNTVCYVVADVYMDFLSDYSRDYLIKTFLCFSGFIVVILIFGFTLAGHNLVFPINSITKAAKMFVNSRGEQKAIDDSVRMVRRLAVSTDDEVEQLYHALCKMEADMAEYVRDIRHYAEATKKMQNGLIITLAGIVENRDSKSTSHVQNTTAYVRIILNGLKNKGYYPEKISDEYIEELEMSSPLHDIGKIHIPDSITNKRSDLTKEEEEILKTHTIYGREIMEKAIDTVKGDTYLKEARNMAAYHHERWDGTGYPEGLHGEVIPLSARIMALADAFDELTAPKRFQMTYTVEEALEIIKEESGKQFDPKCVDAFLSSVNEIKVVLNGGGPFGR